MVQHSRKGDHKREIVRGMGQYGIQQGSGKRKSGKGRGGGFLKGSPLRHIICVRVCVCVCLFMRCACLSLGWCKLKCLCVSVWCVCVCLVGASYFLYDSPHTMCTHLLKAFLSPHPHPYFLITSPCCMYVWAPPKLMSSLLVMCSVVEGVSQLV